MTIKKRWGRFVRRCQTLCRVVNGGACSTCRTWLYPPRMEEERAVVFACRYHDHNIIFVLHQSQLYVGRCLNNLPMNLPTLAEDLHRMDFDDFCEKYATQLQEAGA